VQELINYHAVAGQSDFWYVFTNRPWMEKLVSMKKSILPKTVEDEA
jgi:hypothetical protein